MANYIGIDIGASKILGVLWNGAEVLKWQKDKTPPNADSLESFLIQFIQSLKGKYHLQGIGIGLPGTFSKDYANLTAAPNLNFQPDIALIQTYLGESFKVPIKFENDANCFALAEHLYGAGKPFQNIVALTLGTGLGSGIVLGGRIFHGSFGSAPEIGHMVIRAGGAKCRCGNKGCLEQYASSFFFKRQSKFNARTLYRKAQEKDPETLLLWKYFGYWLGIGLANIANIVGPEAIILGGSIITAKNFFFEEAEKTMRRNILSPIAAQQMNLLKSTLGFKAGAIGAASLFKKR